MKVLIVDDEIVIRRGMVNVLPWLEHDYEVLEPASSGEEAIVIIERERPDIIISDIQMQGISGLKLIKLIADIPYPKEVIILTGFEEFNYVQEAIKQNVSDYLLKTSSPDEILQSVNKARERLNEAHRYLKLEESKEEQQVNSELKRLLYNPVNKHKLQKLLKRVPVLEGMATQLIVINEIVDEQQFYKCKELWNTYVYGRWFTHSEQTLIIVKRNPDLSDFYLLQMAVKKMNEVYKEPLNTSRVFTNLNELSHAYTEAISLFFYKWLLPEKGIISIGDVGKRKGISHLDQYKKHEMELLECIRRGDEEMLGSWVRQFVSWAFTHPMATPKSIEGYIKNLYFSVVRYIDRVGKKTTKEQKNPTINQYLSEPIATLTALFTELMDSIKDPSGGVKKYVTDALYFIEEHLGESITLQEVAKHVHVHPNYLGEMIRRRTGKSYLEIVTNARMERAEGYLIHSQKDINIIANLVGYYDRKYFTKMFKRHYNMTPSLYRKKWGKGN